MTENRLSFGPDDSMFNFTSQSQSEEDSVKHSKKSDNKTLNNVMLNVEEDEEDSDNGFDLMSFDAKPKGKVDLFKLW